MSERDDAAAAFYEDPRNRQTKGEGRRRKVQRGRLSSHVPIRFDAASIEEIKRFATEDGLTVSGWVRAIVMREVRWRLARLTSTEPPQAPISFEMIEGKARGTETTGRGVPLSSVAA